MTDLILLGFGLFTFICGYLLGSDKLAKFLGLEDKNDK